MSDFKKRRETLLNKIKEDSVVILYANSVHRQSEDSTYPFYLNRNFFYLTNINQENSILFLIKSKKLVDEYLFIDRYDQTKEKWFGKKITIEDAIKNSNISEVYLTTDFAFKLNTLLNELEIKNIYIDFSSKENATRTIRREYQEYNILDIHPFIRDLRMIKDEDEINYIKEAIKITSLGLNRIVKEIKTSNYEFELFNSFNHEILNHGTHEIGFPSIIASGVHTCCLHYPTPNDKLDKNSLLLCDVGAGYNHYSSDVTRTYPLSGKFNDFQRKIYQIVLNCNKKVIEYIQVGRTIEELQNFAKSYLAGECLKEGLINSVDDISKYYFHGVSHHLGLDTHDASDRSKPLEVGNIITVEPGLYIEEKATGVRIEDDVLVTKTGREVLSKDIVKEIDDIEKLFI